MSMIEVKVPNIGDFKDVEVIEVLVNPGDQITAEQSLVTVESDKASMEIPSSSSGVLKEMKVKLGDRVSEGSLLALLESAGAGGQGAGGQGGGRTAGGQGGRDGSSGDGSSSGAAASPSTATPSSASASANVARSEVTPPTGAPSSPGSAGGGASRARKPASGSGGGGGAAGTGAHAGGPIEVKVPDIGDFKDVEVIELLVKPGDQVGVDESLVTVESDKASMEIPSSAAGVVKELKVKLGDRVSKGSPLAVLEATAGEAAMNAGAPPAAPAARAHPAQAQATSAAASADAAYMPPPAGPAEVREATTMAAEVSEPTSTAVRNGGQGPAAPEGGQEFKPHASPSVRKFARELGVDLTQVSGSGEKQRITHDDVRNWVKSTIARAGQPQAAAAPAGSPASDGAGLGLIPWPKVDFASFGPVETKPLARIRKISAANLHRNWVMIPHVTNHDEADITELEAFRVKLNSEQQKGAPRVTMLAFLIKACVVTLKKFPEFNASLEGDSIVLKRYWHIGFAADTPNGLMVPVLRDADTKGVLQIAQETSELAAKAREGKLSPSEMQGGTFTISSLGGIGGTYFTPIINAPEVAILGVCRSAHKPVWNGKEFEPRLMLPLSLSWDHRVVDGAAAARFNVFLAQLLADFRRVML